MRMVIKGRTLEYDDNDIIVSILPHTIEIGRMYHRYTLNTPITFVIENHLQR